MSTFINLLSRYIGGEELARIDKDVGIRSGTFS
jgi:hypothetical protein